MQDLPAPGEDDRNKNPLLSNSSPVPEPIGDEALREEPIVVHKKTPWVRLVLLGFFAPVIAMLAFSILFDMMAVGELVLAVAVASIPLSVLLLFLCTYAVYRILRRWPLDNPGYIATSFLCSIAAMIFVIESLQPDAARSLAVSFPTHLLAAALLGEGVRWLVLALPVAGLIGILYGTLVFHVLRKPAAVFKAPSLLLLVVVLPYVCLNLIAPELRFDESPFEIKEVRNKDHEWPYFPTVVPVGVDPADIDACREGYTTKYASYFLCDFHFKDWPGYLAPETQQKIIDTLPSLTYIETAKLPEEKMLDYPWVSIIVTEKDEDLTPYLYAEGKCDIFGLAGMAGSTEVARKSGPIRQLYLPRLATCPSEQTPGGVTVYRQSRVTGVYYYFVKDNTIITLHHQQHDNLRHVIDEAYFADTNYKQQLHIFIDSFRKDT